MTCLRRFFVVVVLVGIARGPIGAQPPLPPFNLALTINDGVATPVYRGWPLLLRGDAVLMTKVAVPFALDPGSLRLDLTPAQGAAIRWPLRRTTEFAVAPTLGPANKSVRVVWLLTAEQTVALVPGDYTARLSWAGRTSPSVQFSIAEAPAPLTDTDEIRRTRLLSQTALYLGDTDGALAVLGPTEARHPESIDLLVQRARVHLQRREYREAFQAAQGAHAIFSRNYPDAEEPPLSILEVESKARAGLFKGIAPGPPLVGPTQNSPSVAQPQEPLPAEVVALYAASAGVAASTSTSTPTPTPATSTPVTSTPTPGTNAAMASNTPPAPSVPTVGAVVPMTELDDAKIISDPAGQWAASAVAGSQYGKTGYSAAKATGAPDVPIVGNSPDAWCPANKSNGTDWLEVTFAKPVHATEVRVRQNDAAGAIAKIEAIEPDGTVHLWWQGADPYVAPTTRGIAWFAVRVAKTDYLVAKIKVTLNLASGPGWKEIDAVQLVSAQAEK